MIKVNKLDNIFWTNGSWEKPNTVPEISEFREFPNILVDWSDNKVTGCCILEGDWNYAYCEDQWYFLKRLRVADREGAWFYGLVKDWWMNFIDKEVTIRGLCTKTSNKELLLDNIDYVDPIITNPCKLYRLNLTDDVSRHWWEDLEEIKGPTISDDHFFHFQLTDKDWWKFFKQIEGTPVLNSEVADLQSNKEARYKKGVVIVAELEFEKTTSNWKQEIIKKLKPFLNKDTLANYVLTKVTQLGQTTVKNLYALTLSNKAVGQFEETARVSRIDFSGLYDIVLAEKVRGRTDATKRPFRKKEINKASLDSRFNSEFIGPFKESTYNYKVLQRKVYLPYLRKNWATNNDFLYRTHLTDTERSTSRVQNTSIVASYAETDPLVPIYQGWFAQGLKSKSKPHDNFYLPYINQLDTTINYQIKEYSTLQGQGNLNGKIEWFNEDNPPEFGFLVFGEKRDRKEWTWWHFRGEERRTIDVIVGLKEGWEKPISSTNDRDVDKWVKRVKGWWTNFDLLNSLYPYSWIYYFSALRNNSLKISYHDWTEWGGNSGFFGTKVNQEGEKNFALDSLQSLITRDIDNNVLDLANFDKRREVYLEKNAITQTFRLPVPIYQNDIFFSDLTAFWEEYDKKEGEYKFATELGWYLDTQKNHRQLQKNYKKNQEGPKVVFYWNNNLKRYQLGIYYTYSVNHTLTKKDNDILRVQFRENNVNTDRLLESAPDGIESKTVLYHHITPIRISKTKQEANIEVLSRNKVAVIDYLKQRTSALRALENLIQKSAKLFGNFSWDEKFLNILKVKQGKQLITIYKGGEPDYEKIYELIQGVNYWNDSDYYREQWYDWWVPNYHSALTIPWHGFRSWFSSGAQNEIINRKNYDFIKFGDGSFLLNHAGEDYNRVIPEIKEGFQRIASQAKDITDIIGDAYTFNTTTHFFGTVNNESFQRDFYSQLGLLDDNNQFIEQEITLKEKLFDLKGTGYYLWIDAEEDAHLIFDEHKAKADILLQEDKVFRLPHIEIPTQDYIDAINQQTSIQIASASYPLQERLVFKTQGGQITTIDDDEYADNTFKLNIHRFSVEGKQNPNDYYIIEYQGARQLLDIKLGIPKRTVQQARTTDVVQLAQLAFEREKWREEFKNRVSIMQINKQREFEEFAFRRERLGNQNTQAGIDMALGITSGFALGIGGGIVGNLLQSSALATQRELISSTRAASGKAVNPLQLRLEGQAQTIRQFNVGKSMAGTVIGAAQQTFHAGMQLRDLALQSRELEADIRQSIGLFAAQMNQIHTEHIYNERAFALQLMKVGNVFEQGEVNDRDITDQYNEKKGLKEVHLIYKVPSRVQREGLERYYSLYGSGCQIPDVEFKFTRVMRVGDIWQFGYIDTITNLWAMEEKDVLRTIFSTGFKILSLRTIHRQVPIPATQTWVDNIDKLLKQATPEQRVALFNKLIVGLDHTETIKQLAENEPDKNKLVTAITPYLDKATLLAKLASSDDKGLLTKFVLKLLDKINEDEVFTEILKHKDKEKLVEEWIDGGTKLARVLWDKYPDHTVAKEVYVEELAKKDETITEYRQELQESHTRALSLQENIGNISENLHNTQIQLQTTQGQLNTAKSNFEKSRKRVEDLRKRNADLDRENRQFKIEKIDLTSKNRQLEADKTKAEQATALQLAETLKVQTELRNTKEELESKKQELTTNTEELEKVKKEKETLTLQYDEQLKKLQACESKPASKGEFVDTHKNVDYVIAKGDPDKIVVTNWNSEKNIWQEVPDLIVKANSTKKLLRLANKKEEYVTSQYPLWSYYSNNWGSEFGTSVNKYSELDGYVNNTNIKQSYAWLGRATVQLDNNLPYLNKEGNLAKPYWYHPIKGWFDYEYADSEKVENFERYQELTKNIVVEQQKTIEGLRQVEKFKEDTHADKFATSALLNAFYKLQYSARSIFLIVDERDFNYSTISSYYFNYSALIWTFYKHHQYEYKKLWTYRSKTPWAWRFTDETYVSDILGDEWLNGYSTDWGNINLNSKCTRNNTECGVKYALHIGSNDLIIMDSAVFMSVPKIIELPTNNNYKNLQLASPIWINYDDGRFTSYNLDSTGNKKLTTYLEYLDFLGFKWSEKKGKPVLKDEGD